MFENLEGN